MDFIDFYKEATGYHPYPYQQRLAEEPWPHLIDIPTGLGKTGAMALAWLYRRYMGDETAPTRLIWCLPMRTLVEQTRDVVEQWTEKLRPLFEEAGRPVPLVEKMMGGAQETEWASWPERPAVLVGTQDMLLSRALMRGYGMSRYAWPMHFAWVHNDALWVFDETQLMGVGVETSAQLEAFRQAFGTVKPSRSIWMSATLAHRQLETVDHPAPSDGWRKLSLNDEDFGLPAVRERTSAGKHVMRSPISLTQDCAKEVDKAGAKSGYASKLAERIVDRHQAGTLTLVIVNRVSRAQAIYEALRILAPEQTATLLHSRFRPVDRQENFKVLTGQDDRIVVSTQVVEAGIDVSAHTLFTELGPWSSLVQRFGRCNRYGEVDEAQVEWIDLVSDRKDKFTALPYEVDDLNTARELLSSLHDVGPATLAEIEYTPPRVVRPVIRRRDIVELFDTTPDLTGNDLDVSRYVRDASVDASVSVFWRDIETPDQTTKAPHRDELCSVTLVALGAFAKRKNVNAYVFDPLESTWLPSERTRLRPGQTILVTSESGGYDPSLGFTGQPAKKNQRVDEVLVSETPVPEGMGDEPGAETRWLSLPEHTQHVVAETRIVIRALGVDEVWSRRLELAAKWHDVGKAHEVFQGMLTTPGTIDERLRPPKENTLWAKSNHMLGRASRRGFRHELASSLAFLQNYAGAKSDADAIAYLIAAHHGKVRLSIRSLPNETEPIGTAAEGLFARGIWHGDVLPEMELSDGTIVPETMLDLRLMRLGRGSWLERTLALRDAKDIGPFRLAWFESLLRVGDHRASARERLRRL